MRSQARRKATEEQLTALRDRTRKLEETTAPIPTRIRRPELAPEERLAGPLEVGDTVFVRSMNQRGEVVGQPNGRGEVEVQIGALKVRVPAEQVERLSKRQARSAERPQPIILPKLDEGFTPELQIDLRGWRVEDALEEVDRYLNNAALAGMPFVRLLHGKGTGALRHAIRTELAHHPLVRSLASAPQNEGGEGVTVVTLAG